MLSWSLKIVWFALSLSGLLACWLVLLSFGKAVGKYWIPVAYCIGATLLEGVFCIGMAWKMDTFRMPKAFCVAQTIIIGFSAVSLSGVCTAFAFATNGMLASQEARLNTQGAFVWKHVYILPVLVIPALTAAGQAVAIIKLDAVHPGDDLHCDARHPLWVRFLGYAGAPILLSLPGLFVSIRSILQIARINKITSQSRPISENYSYDPGPFTKLPHRTSFRRGSRQPTPLPLLSPSPVPPMSPGREAIRPVVASPVLSARQFHLPFSPIDPHMRTPKSSARSSPEPDRASPISSDFPTFRGSPQSRAGYRNESPNSVGAPPPIPGRVAVYEYPPTTTSVSEGSQSHGEVEDWRLLNQTPALKDKASDDKLSLSPLRWTRQLSVEPPETRSSSRSDLQAQYSYNWDELKEKEDGGRGYGQGRFREEIVDEGFVVVDEQHYNYVVDDAYASSQYPQAAQPRRPMSGHSFTRNRIPRPVSSNLSPAIWRILLFQVTFTFVLILASITTLVDVAVHDPNTPSSPSAFGTQHVALLLAAWGPVIVFGHLPAVRQNLNFKLSPGKS